MLRARSYWWNVALLTVRGRGQAQSRIKSSHNFTKALIEQPAAYSANMTYAHDRDASLGVSSP